MKKITLLFSAIALVSLSFYSCEESQLDPSGSDDILSKKPTETIYLDPVQNPDMIHYCGDPQVNELKIGSKGEVIGTVTVSNNDTHLFVTIESPLGFREVAEGEHNIKMWVGTDIDDLTNKNPNPNSGSVPNANRPAPGHYTYKDRVSGNVIDSKVTYEIPLSDFDSADEEFVCPNDLYVVVHVDYLNDETAFSGNEIGNSGHGSWWWYSEYTTECCNPCFCGFGYNNLDLVEAYNASLSADFYGVQFKLWSNRFTFNDIYGSENSNHEYKLLLVANSNTDTPLDDGGNKVGEEMDAVIVGEVVLKVYKDGVSQDRYIDVKYIINNEFMDSNIQLDLYIGSKRIPAYNTNPNVMMVKESEGDDHSSEVYQTILGEDTSGNTILEYTFMKKPWPVDADDIDAFIAPHAAIGDCPMPSLQGDDESNDDI